LLHDLLKGFPMSRCLSRPACFSILAALSLAGGAALFTGCDAETGPVTAASSEFRPAGEDGDAPATGDANDVTRSAANDPTQPATGSKTAPPAQGDDVATLVAFIDKLARQQPQGATQEEQIRDFIGMQNARLDAAKKVLAMNPDDETKQRVVGAAMEILNIFNQASLVEV
jgi:hypothetical protein